MDEKPDAEAERFPARLVAGAMGLATTGIFPVFLAGALAVQMSKEFGYGPRGIGVSIAGFYTTSSASSVLLGKWADQIGWERALRLSAAGAIASLTSIALLANSLVSVILLIGIAGIANALLQPTVNLMLARESPMSRRGLVFGMKQSAIPIATFLGGVSVPAIALTVGWRWAFVASAGFGLLFLLQTPTRPAVPVGTLPMRGAGTKMSKPLRSTARYVLVSLFGQSGASVLGSFVVVTAVHVGIGEGSAGLLLAAASIAGIASRVYMGWKADYGLRLDLVPVAALMAAGSVGLALAAIPSVWAVVVGVFIGFVAAWGWPGIFNLIVIDRFSEAPATATSATQTGVYIGNGVGPLLFGLVAAWSFVGAWLISAGFLLLAGIIAATSPTTQEGLVTP